MFDYSSWLLASDIDGTLNNKKRKLPENNKKAIHDFVNKGGNFTLCSGRNLRSLTPHYKNLDLKSPAIFMNGAGIYDFKTDKLLSFTPVTADVEDFCFSAHKKFSVELSAYTVDTIYSLGKFQISGFVSSKLDNLPRVVVKNEAEMIRGVWGKANFFGMPYSIKKLKDYFLKNNAEDFCEFFNTSPFTLEVVSKNVNKGTAVLKLAEILGVPEENTAAIGDYYNDLKMLKAVKHPVCCGQAPDDIKEISEYVACHCNNGAVADFINYLNKKYFR